MSNTIKTRLENVSSQLDIAINKANNLPNAESGGGDNPAVETCTITFMGLDMMGSLPIYLYYMKPDLTTGIATVNSSPDGDGIESVEIIALKNSFASVVSESIIQGCYVRADVSGDAENAIWGAECTTVLINGDCLISVTIG